MRHKASIPTSTMLRASGRLAAASLVALLASAPTHVLAASEKGYRSIRLLAVEAGAGFSCGLQLDHSAVCWGDDDSGQTAPPGGAFTQLATGDEGACGLRPSRRAVCWGSYNYTHFGPPSGARFSSITLGWGQPCGVKYTGGSSGPVICWGQRGLSYKAPIGYFTRLSSGINAVCGIRRNGTLGCGGYPSLVAAKLPEGKFIALSVGGNFNSSLLEFACGITTSKALKCWGADPSGQTNAPPGEFTQISTGGTFACGLRMDGAIACWGSDLPPPPSSSFRQVASGEWSACGLRMDGRTICWGANDWGETEVPAAPFSQVSAGPEYEGCGLRADDSVTCWGVPLGAVPFPVGRFSQVSLSPTEPGYVCGLRVSGSIACWSGYGEEFFPGGRTTFPGHFTQTSAGYLELCAVGSNQMLSCWGWDPKVEVPAGRFTQVSVGDGAACAIRTDRAVACWSTERGSSAPTPDPGRFKQVITGGPAACGLGVSGSIDCWSNAAGAGPQSLPAGKFQALAIAFTYGGAFCGLKADGAITCLPGKGPWSTGTYVAISASGHNLCAIDASGGVYCWGSLPVYLPASTPAEKG